MEEAEVRVRMTRLAIEHAIEDREWLEAERLARQTIEAHPSSDEAKHILIAFLSASGRSAEAVRLLEEWEGWSATSGSAPASLTPAFRRRSARPIVTGAIVAAVILAVALGRGTTSHLRAQYARPAIHAATYAETNALLLSAQQDYDAARYAKAEATLRRVLALSEQPAVHDARKSALLQLGQVRAARGDLRSAEATWQEALSVLRENPEAGLDTAHALNMLGNVRRQLGDLDGAETALTESEQIRIAKGDATGVVLCTRDRARVELARGRAAAARTLTEKAQALCRPLNKPDIEADLRGDLARAALADGNLKEARQLADDCLVYWKAKGHTRWIAELEQLVAEVALKQGRASEARPLIEDSIRRMEAVGDRLGAAEGKLVQAGYALISIDPGPR